tara:strand:- start:686 stop:871 length:186 start_codon:yes stop_codon:yes gene_type:complete
MHVATENNIFFWGGGVFVVGVSRFFAVFVVVVVGSWCGPGAILLLFCVNLRAVYLLSFGVC